MKFKSLKINNWKQFDAVDIEFHDRLTVLTGANGSGKTTLLNLLGRHLDWGFRELSTPAKKELQTNNKNTVSNMSDGQLPLLIRRKTESSGFIRESEGACESKLRS